MADYHTTNKTNSNTMNVNSERLRRARFGLGNPARKLVQTLAVAASLAVLSSTAELRAQANAEGYIYGSVAGETGATVTAVNVGTGLTRSATVKADGTYDLPALPVGTYNVTVTKGGAKVKSEEGVTVGVGAGTAVRFDASKDGVLKMEAMEVSGSQLSPIDVSQTGASLSLQKATVDALPIQRNLTAITLMAPGTSLGDTAFGNLASFAGASVAENNVYINGFNVTNFRNGLGFSQVPFDFQDSFEVMVGGYGPQYGRSTGGVTNVVTKSGSNKIVTGGNVFYQPSRLASKAPDVYLKDGTIYRANSLNSSVRKEADVYAGFPVWKNHLFVYGLYDWRKNSHEFAGTSAGDYYKDKTDNPFWGLKADFQLNDNHRIEWTGFSDKDTTVEDRYAYTWATRKVGSYYGPSYFDRGGRNDIYRYSGQFTEYFRASLLYGKGSYSLTDRGSGDSNPAVYDGRSGTLVPLGNWTALTPSVASDERKAYRADGVVTVAKHSIKFGYDKEDNVSHDLTHYSGGVYYRYYNRPSSGVQNGAAVPAGTFLVRERRYNVGGDFKVKNNAYYAQDDFKLMDDKLLFSLGIRNEGFKNFNRNEEVFVEAKNQWAPRLSVSYDPSGTGKSKIYANYGIYYLPIASNTNIRASGGESDIVDWYAVSGINPDGTPIKVTKLGGTIVNADGVPPPAGSVAAQNLKPMYQSEYILGGQFQLANNWTFSVRGTYRNLDSTIDDTLVNNSTPEDIGAVARWAKRTGNADFSANLGSNHYVLFNPGKDLTFLADVKGDGKLVPVTLTKADLQMPEAVRKYYAMAFILERQFSKKAGVNLSYTWSHSYGNMEGWVKSDTGQDDAGLTAAFDLPEFMVNAYGDLPNDRRHMFKAYGWYRVIKDVTMGVNATLESGRAKNKLGSPRTHPPTGYEGATFLAPRGSQGRTAWVPTLDWSAEYTPKIYGHKVTLAVDVFNVFNSAAVRQVFENYEDASYSPDARYGLTTAFQAPRTVRFSVGFDW